MRDKHAHKRGRETQQTQPQGTALCSWTEGGVSGPAPLVCQLEKTARHLRSPRFEAHHQNPKLPNRRRSSYQLPMLLATSYATQRACAWRVPQAAIIRHRHLNHMHGTAPTRFHCVPIPSFHTPPSSSPLHLHQIPAANTPIHPPQHSPTMGIKDLLIGVASHRAGIMPPSAHRLICLLCLIATVNTTADITRSGSTSSASPQSPCSPSLQ